MDLATIIADVQIAVSLAKLAVQVGQDAAPYIQNAYAILFQNKMLTADERAAMIAQETKWRSDIDTTIAADDAAGAA